MADDDTAPIDRAPRDSLTALHADLLAGMVDGNTAAARLEALMDELQSAYTLPELPEDIAVEVPKPQMPTLEKVDEPDEGDA